jgi:hypothetical protein
VASRLASPRALSGRVLIGEARPEQILPPLIPAGDPVFRGLGRPIRMAGVERWGGILLDAHLDALRDDLAGQFGRDAEAEVRAARRQ